MTKIKICGLFRTEDIAAVNEAMPDYIGFVFAQSRRQVSPQQAGSLKQLLSERIVAVGVFKDDDMGFICKLSDAGIIDMIQLHGSEDESFIQTLQRQTGRPVIKAVSVINPPSVQQWQDSQADYLLLDSGKGGSGQCFDWGIAGQSKKPFFLAGGLNLENIRQAIDSLHPFAVDVSSGVETNGGKDTQKIKDFIRRVRL
ncbi:MAG: phosphoribosylanthranilate isomerase [Christensenellales bacterium]